MSKVVTPESVIEAAEVLVAEGKKPSVRAVIAALGGGSPNSVLLHLNRWKAGLPPAPVQDLRVDARVARILTEQLARETAAACSEMEQKLAVAEENALAVAEAGEKAERALATSEQENAVLKTEAAELRGRLAQMSGELEAGRAALEAQREVAEGLRAEVARQQVRLEGIPRLEGEVERLRAALDQERTARAAAEQAAAVTGARLESAEAQVADLKARIEKAGKGR
jgi:SMC interacting uncharacterized protein involved in chromosome segregation